MSSIVISGDTSGAVTIEAPAIAGTPTLTLPTTSGTLVVTGGAQTVQFAAGTVSAPSITFTGDTNTGIYSPAADTIAFTEGGVESMRIDSSGNVGIGTSSPSGRLQVEASQNSEMQLRLRNSSSGSSARTVLLLGNDANAGTAGIYLNSSTNTTAGGGANSLTMYMGLGAPITFETSAVERMRVNAGAPILCLAGGNTSATGTGIAFPATQSASTDANTLDDYEEGTWTPTFLFTSNGSATFTYATQEGRYTKIGRLVTIFGFLTCTVVKSNATGDLKIGGLPFTPINLNNDYPVGPCYTNNFPNAIPTNVLQNSGVTELYIAKTTSQATIGVGDLNATNTSLNIRFTFSYIAT